MISNAPMDMRGNIAAAISILKPMSEISHGVIVDPRFAPMMMPMPWCSERMPAPTNHNISIETIVLLWSMDVVTVPVMILDTIFLVNVDNQAFID